MSGYWSEGRFVAGTTVKTAGMGGVSGLELEVAAAVARARENGGALEELRRLMDEHPPLKRDVEEGEEHCLTPIAWAYAEEQLIW